MPDLSHEQAAQAAGYRTICGIDEAGRGPLAGPVCTAAVILPPHYTCPGLDDSKKLTPKKRDHLYQLITTDPHIQWAHDCAEPNEIDTINILAATHVSMARSVAALQRKYHITIDHCLIDGLAVPRFPHSQTAIVKGDTHSLSIAAASIIAKVTRDRIMLHYASQFPQYGFEKHMGYGTKLHLIALTQHGPCIIHRRSFQPVAQLTLPLDAP